MALQELLAGAASLVALILILALQKALWPRRSNPAVAALFGLLVALGVAAFYDLGIHTARGVAMIAQDPALLTWHERIHRLWPLSDAALLLASACWAHLFLIHPEPFPWLRRAPWMLKAAYGPPAIVALWTLLHPLLHAPSEVHLLAFARAGEYACTIVGGCYTIAGWALLLYRAFRSRDPVIRRPLRAIAVWTSSVVAGLLALSLIPQWLGLPVPIKENPLLGAVALLVLPVTFGYAMVRYNWLDTELRIGFSLAYALAVIVVIGVYLLLTELLVRLGGTAIPPDHPALLAIFALVVTLGLHPLRLWLQEQIDRLFERRRYDERQVLHALGEHLAGVQELPALARVIVDLVVSIWPARTAALVLRDEERGGYATRETWGLPPGRLELRFPPDSPVVQEILNSRAPVAWKELVQRGLPPQDLEALRLLQGDLYVPLSPAERQLGWLQLGELRYGGAYSRRDRELLTLVADRSGAALAHALLNEQNRREAAALELLSRIGLAASSLEISDLLEWIWRETTHLLGGDNFAIALRDLLTDEWHWAFVVKKGTRRSDREGKPWSAASGLAAEVVRTGEPILARDYRAECERRGIPPWEHEPEEPDTAWLGVPLVTGTHTLGVLTLSSLRKDFAYRPEHLQLLATIAAQAAVAIEKAQAHAREEERLAELEILNEIAQTVGTSIRLEEVLRLIYQAVLRVLNAPNFYVALYDDARQEFSFALYVEDGQILEPPAEPWPLGEGLSSELVRTRQPIVTDDYLTECARRGVVPGGKPGKAWLGVPLIAADEVIGVMVASSFDEGTSFGPDDVLLFSTIAGQVAGAVQNARRFEESQRRLEELSTLVQIGTTISSSLDLRQVLDNVCREAVRLLQATSAYVSLWEEARRASTVVAHYISPEACPLEQISDLWVTYEETEELAALLREGKPAVWRVSDPFVALDEREHLEQYGGKSVLFLPLIGGAGPLGFIEVWESRTERVFTEEEILLGQSLAAQAAIAIENARLYERTDAALARRVSELSTIEEISRELNRLLDLQRIIDVVLERAIEATGADAGGVGLLTEDERGLMLLTGRGYPPEIMEQVRSHPWSVERGIIGRVVRTGEPALVEDVRTDPDYVEFIPTTLSELAVPIRYQERVVGAVVLESERLGAFDAEHLRFVRHLADHAAIAMRNARLLEERERRITQLSILNEIARVLSSTRELPELVETVYRQVGRLFDTTNFYIALYDEREGTWQTAIDIEHGQRMPPTRLSVEEGVTGYIIRERRPVLLRSEAEDRAFHETLGLRAVGETPKSWVGVPLIAADKVVGVMALQSYEQENLFDEEDVALLSTIASQVAIAIQNARLFQEITQARDRLQAILESTHDGIIMLDTEGRILLANPPIERWAGVMRERIVGRTLPALLRQAARQNPEAARAMLEQLRKGLQMLAQDPTGVLQGEFDNPTGIAQAFAWVSAPVLDQQGEHIGRILVLRDITEAREAERMREDLVSMIVHDLRSPLTAFLGGLQAILGRDLGPLTNEQRLLLETALEGGHEMLEMVNTLLDIRRLEAGKMPLHFAAVLLEQSVHQAINRLKPLIDERRLTVTVDIPANLTVRADQEKLERVWENLVHNAIKYSYMGGVVRIGGRVEAGLALCYVTDYGVGIPKSQQEHIFEKFAQASQPGGPRGSGLGLAFCRLAVEAQGGRIWVESEEGKGSTFYFTVPLWEG